MTISHSADGKSNRSTKGVAPSFPAAALAVLLATASSAANTSAGATDAATNDAAQTVQTGQVGPDIVVTAPPLFPDLQPERNLDEQDISSYAASTVDELLGELGAELGDDDEQPLILVNGQRVNDLDEIGAYPVEVLRGVQVLPRGSATRVGGSPHQRVISLSLKRQVRSATLTVAPRIATEGDWSAFRGEAILTQIRGNTRANLALRVRNESSLFESERGIVQPDPRLPFALSGNVIAFPTFGDEIDPALSTAAGEIVTVAPVPPTSTPTLDDFADAANEQNFTDLGDFRTLRPKVGNYDLNGTYSAPLTSWLTSTTTLRLSRYESRSKRGLPGAEFIVSADNPFSPFSTDVGLTLYGPRPLESRSRRDTGELALTLDGRFGEWISNFNARHTENKDIYETERQSTFAAIPLDDSVNPFATDLGGLLDFVTDRSTSRSNDTLALLSLTGPAAQLPAGALQLTAEGRLAWRDIHSQSSFSGSDRDFHRNEQSVRAAVDIPLTAADGYLAQLGDTTVTADFSRTHYSDAGTLDHYAAGIVWEPRPPIRLRAGFESTERPAPIQTLGSAIVVTPQVRVFDPLTGDTVDVIQVTGGIPGLQPETLKVKRLGGLLRLVPRLNLQLSAEYTDTDLRDFVSSLPAASAPVMLAFPDRYVRDSNGVLTLVDLRPVNFDSHREKRLRWGLSMQTRLGGGSPVPIQPAQSSEGDARDDEGDREVPLPVRRGPAQRTSLQLTINHTVVFSDKIVIRPELDSVDLLEGGAIGIASGRVRHQVDATAAVTSGGLGARVGIAWRGRSFLDTRIDDRIDTLRFSPLFLVNIRAFADGNRIFPRSRWAKGLRLSLNVVNLTGDRQEVRDSFGDTPLQYQPAYRDPLGRTIELEIRKVF